MEKTTTGQPRKYDEPTKGIAFKLPITAIQKLKKLAKLNNVSSTQYVLTKIEEDFNRNKEIIENITRLQKELSEELAKIRKE